MVPAVVLLLLSFVAVFAQDESFDLLIRNARIADGSGNPWYTGSIGIRGERIAAIGLLRNATAARTIDAKGHVAAPGFIDIHSHARSGFFKHPAAENLIRNGVTSVIEGNDGGSPLPIAPFLAEVRATRSTVNFGLFVGQGSVRREVMGLADRNATPAEIARMQELVRQAMRDGAFGMSTGLFYIPGNFTPVEEVIALGRVAGEMGGMHISHMRDEAANVVDSVKETIRIGEEGRMPTQVTHHKIIGAGNWGRSADTIRLIEEARKRGVDVSVDQYPYTASSTGTAAMFPQWAQEGGQEKLLERLRDPGQRAKIKAEIARRIEFDRGGGNPKNIVMANCGFDTSLDGKHLAQITDERGRTPSFETAAETAIEIQQKGGCSAIYHAINEQDLERILRYPGTMVASDGGIPTMGSGVPHPRNYGTFARVLGRYVREKNVIPLEEAIRKMTSLPANRLGLLDRGLLRPGMQADIVIFDPATVADRATFAEPHQYSVGFTNVLVNGKPVLLEGKLTAERPGQVLLGPAARTPR